MDTAEKILIVGGVCLLTYGFLLGIPVSMIRMKSPHAPRALITAHLASIIQGALLVALSRAVSLSALAPGVETMAAGVLVVGVSLFALGSTANWLQGVEDHFATRPVGWWLLAVSGPLNIAAAVVLLVGVVMGL